MPTTLQLVGEIAQCFDGGVDGVLDFPCPGEMFASGTA
jgi:hypothetical protein